MISPSGEIVSGNPNTDCKTCFSILNCEKKGIFNKNVSVVLLICPFCKFNFVDILVFLFIF